MKKKAYVIGSRVKESLSPTIFNYWFEKTGIDAEYTYIEINSKNLETEIKKIFNEKNVCGLNVTIPHKGNIINYLDGIDIHSKRIGAINCLTKKNNHWFGTNTDWVGFSKSLSEIKKLKSHRLLPF